MTREEQMTAAADKAWECSEHDCDYLTFISNYMQGWDDADQHPQWIPVGKELPKEKGAYLFHFDDGQTRVEGYFPELHLSKCVTHWMPLPVPPRKEE